MARDLHSVLDSRISLPEVLERKRRHAVSARSIPEPQRVTHRSSPPIAGSVRRETGSLSRCWSARPEKSLRHKNPKAVLEVDRVDTLAPQPARVRQDVHEGDRADDSASRGPPLVR